MLSYVPWLDVHAVALIDFLIYLLLPLGTGLILHGQDRPARLQQWCWGSALLSLLPLAGALELHRLPFTMVSLSFDLSYLGMLLRVRALRDHLRETVPLRDFLLWWLALAGLSETVARIGLSPLMVYCASVQALGGLWVVRLAWRLGRQLPSRSAQAMAIAYAAAAAVLLFRVQAILTEHLQGHTVDAIGQNVHSLILTLLVLMTGIFGHIAYIGITLEGVRAREQARTQEAVRATAAQRQSEAQSAQLRELLRERDEMLHLLAHEVRQPLNNASAALQSARTAASRALVDATASSLVVRLDRAGGVIRQITSILDNTLTASSLISSDSRLAPVEADLTALVELCLADLAPLQRARVRVDHDPGLRTAAFDPGLLRLALRNLLLNGLRHSPPGTAVVLCVSEQDEPLAVLFEVIDQGPGFDPALREHAFERGMRDPRSPGLGLGLYIVRRVAELHHGRVEIVPPDPTRPGTRLRLTLPQDPID